YFTTKADGTGLGLAVVQNIIEQHGGAIKVKSIEGKGAVFTIWLPVIARQQD
ncbi:sensor protein ZraS, partial [Salmonella enterica subsp. enterica serovar Newport]